jgi:hypothetical protein
MLLKLLLGKVDFHLLFHCKRDSCSEKFSITSMVVSIGGCKNAEIILKLFWSAIFTSAPFKSKLQQ